MQPTDATPGLCPLCGHRPAALFFVSRGKRLERQFMRCPCCDLVFVPKRYHLSQRDEKERYLQHNNDPENEDYRQFLSRLLDPLRVHLSPGARGLDYGAGPGPALKRMLQEEGYEASMYDPFFAPDRSTLETMYDFVTCTETAEHFSHPRDEFDRFQALLKAPGWLGVMTGMLDSWDEFPDWHYHRDPTHICFYSKTTMSWIARRYSWDVGFPRQNVALFHKLP